MLSVLKTGGQIGLMKPCCERIMGQNTSVIDVIHLTSVHNPGIHQCLHGHLIQSQVFIRNNINQQYLRLYIYCISTVVYLYIYILLKKSSFAKENPFVCFICFQKHLLMQRISNLDKSFKSILLLPVDVLKINKC